MKHVFVQTPRNSGNQIESKLWFDTGDIMESVLENEYAPVKGVGDKAREKRRKQYAEQIQRGVENGE